MIRNSKKGFTVVEMLVYIVVLVLLVFTASSFLIWMFQTNRKIKSIREVSEDLRRTMEAMTYQIRASNSIYTPTSVFENASGQISLETSNFLPAGENLTFIDFFLCGTQICLKKENQLPLPVSSDEVEITNLIFNQVATASATPSIKIEIEGRFKTNNPENQATTTITSTVSLRSY